MWWERNYAYHIPEQYREHLGVKDAVNVYKMLLWVPLLGVLLIGLYVISMVFDEPRMLYSETIIQQFEVSNKKDKITMKINGGYFHEGITKIFEYEVSPIAEDNILIKIGNKTEEASPWQSGVIIEMPIEKEIKHISVEQRNGRKQLWLEKNKKTGKWEYAKPITKLTFFAEHYTGEFIVFLLINISIITATILLIKWLIKRSIKKSRKNQDEEDVE